MRALDTTLIPALALVCLAVGCAGAPPPPDPPDPYASDIQEWRRGREERLLSDTGWLTVAGLFWLDPGENTLGADPASDIVLPESAPAKVGVIDYADGAATFRAADGVTVTANDEPVVERRLRDDTVEETDILAVGRLRFFIIARGDRHALRLRDLDSSYRREFTGLSWFPVNSDWRVEARFVPHDPPRILKVGNIIGTVDEEPSPGYAVWMHDGVEARLEPIVSGDELFFIFRDATSDDTTYPAGRYLYTPMPEEGRVVLDFNKAYTPPCAFTPYATCPLPPEGNRLAFRIEAGEKNYSAPH